MYRWDHPADPQHRCHLCSLAFANTQALADHESSQVHMDALAHYIMADEYERLRDILEEDERRSIRNTLAAAVPTPTRASGGVRVDPYKREVNTWLRPGMPWPEAEKLIHERLALPVTRDGGRAVCRTTGSNRLHAVHIAITEDEHVRSVTFEANS